MYKVYRKASPRTGRKFDMRFVPHRQLAQHLRAGWSEEIPGQESDPEPEPEEEPLPKPKAKSKPKKLKYKDFTDLEKDNIKKDKRPIIKLAKVHNTTLYAIKKIKGMKP